MLRWILSMVLLMALLGDSFAVATDTFYSLWKKHPFYFGGIFGYGSTDWSMLIPSCDPGDSSCDRETLHVSAPTSAGDFGRVWGATMGYEVQPFWALEWSYLSLPTTTIKFGKDWTFYSEKFDVSQLRSKTFATIFVAKFMTQISHSGFRGFANAGVDFTFRHDQLSHAARVNPTFGVGVNYVLPSQVMLEFAFQYVSGFGICDEIPAKHYIPFLYSLTGRILYRI